MSPLLRRKRTLEDPGTEPLATSADAPTEVLDVEPDAPQPTPAGVALQDEIGPRPDTRRRGRLRRRLRHLRRVRELMLRDVGGLVYEFHRSGEGSAAQEHQGALVRSKLDRLVGLDAERRQLEATLGDRRAQTVLREPGVGGTCPGCGEYFASDARFCAHCGVRVDGRGAITDPAPAGPEPLAHEPVAPEPVTAEASS